MRQSALHGKLLTLSPSLDPGSLDELIVSVSDILHHHRLAESSSLERFRVATMYACGYLDAKRGRDQVCRPSLGLPVDPCVPSSAFVSLPRHVERKIAARWKEWEPWAIIHLYHRHCDPAGCRPSCNACADGTGSRSCHSSMRGIETSSEGIGSMTLGLRTRHSC